MEDQAPPAPRLPPLDAAYKRRAEERRRTLVGGKTTLKDMPDSATFDDLSIEERLTLCWEATKTAFAFSGKGLCSLPRSQWPGGKRELRPRESSEE